MADAPSQQHRLSQRLIGRTFIHPAFDYLFIGGGLSLIVIPVVFLYAGRGAASMSFRILALVHFVKQQRPFRGLVRSPVYQARTCEALPFLTMAFPLLTIAVLSLSLVFADQTGPVLQAIYLGWSPFHYAAQAYGLAVMYSYRSGCQLNTTHKQLLWWIAILPSIRVLVQSSDEHFLWWLTPNATALAVAPWSLPLHMAVVLLGGLALILPVVLYFSVVQHGPCACR